MKHHVNFGRFAHNVESKLIKPFEKKVVAPVYKDIIKPIAQIPVKSAEATQELVRDAGKAVSSPGFLVAAAVLGGLILLRR